MAAQSHHFLLISKARVLEFELTRADYIANTLTEPYTQETTTGKQTGATVLPFHLTGCTNSGCKHVKGPGVDVIIVGQAAKLLMPLYGGERNPFPQYKAKSATARFTLLESVTQVDLKTFLGLQATRKIHGVLMVQPAEENVLSS